MINRVVIGAMHDRLEKSYGQRVGIYSYPFQWGIITSGWHNGWPAWTATGSKDRQAAVHACSDSFTAGPVLMAQYTPGKSDKNVTCQSGQRP
jgi:GH25 family lysozyme M1 (1,4-beta-N-acetylmuramidase)